MDPLTICTTVTGLVTTCGTAATMCSGLITKYKTAPAILASIRTECITVKAALSYVDWIIKRDADLLSSQLKAHSPLVEILDVPLTGCIFTFSLLDIELQKLYDRSKDYDSYKWKDRMKYVWNEDQVKAILDHMRGLQSALNLVLTALQTSSTSALIPLLQEQNPVLERVRKNTKSIHESLSLQFDLKVDADRRAFSEISSVFDSSIGDEEFSFDDEIINTFAYRNAMKRLSSKAKSAQQNPKPDERHILDEPLIDLEELPQTPCELKAKSTTSSDYQCLNSNITSTHTALHGYMEDLKMLIAMPVQSPSQPQNKTHAAMTSSSPMSGSLNDMPAYLRDSSRVAEEVTQQHVRDDECRETCHIHRLSMQPVQASDEPLESSDPSTNIDAGTTKSLQRDSETQNAHERKDRLALIVEEQVVREESHMVSPFSPRTPASARKDLFMYHENTTYSDGIVEQVETQRQDTANSLRGWTDRYMDEGQYDHISNTKASEDGNILSSSLAVENLNMNFKPDEDKEMSTTKVTHKKVVPSQKTRRSSGQSSNGKRSPTAKEMALASLTAGAYLTTDALKRHKKENYSKREYRDSRVQCNDRDSGHGLNPPANIELKHGHKVASETSLVNLETVHNAFRNLILPELRAFIQEQTMGGKAQLREPGHPDVTASPQANFSEHTSVYDAPQTLKRLPSRGGDDIDIRHHAEDLIAKDYSRLTQCTINRSNTHDKGRTNLRLEYIESGTRNDPAFERRKSKGDSDANGSFRAKKLSRHRPGYLRQPD